jgi:hypothetical protein
MDSLNLWGETDLKAADFEVSCHTKRQSRSDLGSRISHGVRIRIMKIVKRDELPLIGLAVDNEEVVAVEDEFRCLAIIIGLANLQHNFTTLMTESRNDSAAPQMICYMYT